MSQLRLFKSLWKLPENLPQENFIQKGNLKAMETKFSQSSLFKDTLKETLLRNRDTYLRFFLEVNLSDRVSLKGFYHLVKLLSETPDYEKLLDSSHTLLKALDFDYDNLSIDWVFSDNPEYQKLYLILRLFHPTHIRSMRGWVLTAKSGRGIVGLISFTPSPINISPRKLLGLTEAFYSDANLRKLTSTLINTFLWASRSLAFGSFRKSRGLKALYKSVFTEGLYQKLHKREERHFTGIEATTLYTNNSKVFRNMHPLKVIKSTTTGYTDGFIPKPFRNGNLFRTVRNKQLRKLIHEYTFPKGYYFLTPYDNIQEVLQNCLLSRTMPSHPPTYSLQEALSCLTYSDGSSDKEFLKQYLYTEKKVWLLLKTQPLSDHILHKAFELIKEFHKEAS